MINLFCVFISAFGAGALFTQGQMAAGYFNVFAALFNLVLVWRAFGRKSWWAESYNQENG